MGKMKAKYFTDTDKESEMELENIFVKPPEVTPHSFIIQRDILGIPYDIQVEFIYTAQSDEEERIDLVAAFLRIHDDWLKINIHVNQIEPIKEKLWSVSDEWRF